MARLLLMIACVLLALGSQAQGQHYAGKQIRFIVGGDAGGGYDLLARVVAPHLGRHVSGNPAVIVQNMPEAGSLTAANYLASSAPKDGTVFALLQRGMLLAWMTNPSGARFDLQTLSWIANLNHETSLVVAWHTAQPRTAEDLFQKTLVVGGTVGVDPEITPKMYNGLIGTKFKIVNGYKGTNDIARAMENGEVEGIGDWSWSTFKVQKAAWLKDGKVRVLMQGAQKRDPELSDIPNALEFAKDDVTRQAMELYLSQKTVARPIAAPPGVPAEQVTILHEAFLSLAKDPVFLEAVQKVGSEINVLSGEAVTEVIRTIGAAPQEVVQRLKGAIGGAPN